MCAIVIVVAPRVAGQPINVIASGAALEQLKRDDPERLAELVQLAQGELAEVCGGQYLERDAGPGAAPSSATGCWWRDDGAACAGETSLARCYQEVFNSPIPFSD